MKEIKAKNTTIKMNGFSKNHDSDDCDDGQKNAEERLLLGQTIEEALEEFQKNLVQMKDCIHSLTNSYKNKAASDTIIPSTQKHTSTTKHLPIPTTGTSPSKSNTTATGIVYQKQISQNTVPSNTSSTRRKKKNSKKKATIFPCPARATPGDHNSKSAYFIVPNDVKHGHRLICSHKFCNTYPVRFVYCKVCEKPVARRNFSTRHYHEDSREALGLLGDCQTSSSNTAATATRRMNL